MNHLMRPTHKNVNYSVGHGGQMKEAKGKVFGEEKKNSKEEQNFGKCKTKPSSLVTFCSLGRRNYGNFIWKSTANVACRVKPVQGSKMRRRTQTRLQGKTQKGQTNSKFALSRRGNQFRISWGILAHVATRLSLARDRG